MNENKDTKILVYKAIKEGGKKKEFRSPKICSIIRVPKMTLSSVIKQRVNELF